MATGQDPCPAELALPAEPKSVPAFRALARRWAQGAGMSIEQACDVALAVTEAATNAVLHAFTERPAGTVTLRVWAEDGRAVFHVLDDGRGLAPRIDSPGVGLGIPTIGRLADHLDVGPGPAGGTEVRMAFNVPGLGDPEASLRARLAASYDQMADAVLVHDEDGRFVYANDRAVRSLGVSSREELLARRPGETAARFAITWPDGSVPALEDWPHRRLFTGDQPPAPMLTRSVELATGRTTWNETTATLLTDAPSGRRLSLGVVRDVTEAVEAANRSRLLSEAGRRLQLAAVDLEGTFTEIAALTVPDLADWCAVDVADCDGVLRRMALAHRDPEKVASGREIHERWPPDPEAPRGPYAVLRTGEPLFIPELTPEVLEEVEDAEHRAALLAIGMRSVVLVPLVGREGPVGVLTLVTADSHRVFDEEFVAFAGRLGAQAGVAVENARLIGGRRP